MLSRNSSLHQALLGGAALALVAWIGTGTAHATPLLPGLGATVHVTSSQLAGSPTATISFAGLPGGNSSLTVYISPELFTGTFGASNTPFSNLLVYCTDLHDYESTPETYTVGYLTSSYQPNSTPALSTTQVNNIATLIADNYTDQAATQLAIWSVEYGNAFSFSNTTSTISNDVTTELAGLNGTAPPNEVLYQLQASGAQGFVYLDPIPEPASMAVLGVAMIGIGAARRRGARRRASA